MSKYQIVLKNCAFFARHGVHTEEAVLGQRFFVDAKLQVSSNDAVISDEIDGTVHYGEVFSLIESMVTGTRRYLIEALAQEVARAVYDGFPLVTAAEITIRKPHAAVPGIFDYVEVTVSWPQNNRA